MQQLSNQDASNVSVSIINQTEIELLQMMMLRFMDP